MKNHWTNYLPEAGTIAKLGEPQMHLLERIKDLQQQLADAKEEHKQNESTIVKTVLKHWTWGEIDEAKAKAEITQRVVG
jgi:glutamate synthase domain-containing protein 2